MGEREKKKRGWREAHNRSFRKNLWKKVKEVGREGSDLFCVELGFLLCVCVWSVQTCTEEIWWNMRYWTHLKLCNYWRWTKHLFFKLKALSFMKKCMSPTNFNARVLHSSYDKKWLSSSSFGQNLKMLCMISNLQDVTLNVCAVTDSLQLPHGILGTVFSGI